MSVCVVSAGEPQLLTGVVRRKAPACARHCCFRLGFGSLHNMGHRTGHYAIIEQFLADGITHMFGNPGTVEQGFLDALRAYPQMKYILTLQETIAVLAAD